MKKSAHPSPANLRFAILATDVALFTIVDGKLMVRLIRVDRAPMISGTQGLPGGLIDPKETAQEAAERLVQSKAGIDSNHVHLEQLYTFSKVDRDPRGRVVAVAYLGLVPWTKLTDAEQANSEQAQWVSLSKARSLAYDHDEILRAAIERLRSRTSYTTLLAKLMPAEFTLTELENAYASILQTELDKRNFRKKILKLGILKELPKKRTAGRSRPAQLYRFAHKEVREIEII